MLNCNLECDRTCKTGSFKYNQYTPLPRKGETLEWGGNTYKVVKVSHVIKDDHIATTLLLNDMGW